MAETIKDGSGDGYEAKVDKHNKLYTFSVQRREKQEVAERDGQSFIFNLSGFIPIGVTDTEYGIMYLKNTSTDKHLYIDGVRVCGTATQKWRLYKGADAGSLVTFANPIREENTNFTSANSAVVDAYRGSGTSSGGVEIDSFVNDVGPYTEPYDGSLILGTNDSIALTVEMPASGDVGCSVVGYYKVNE